MAIRTGKTSGTIGSTSDVALNSLNATRREDWGSGASPSLYNVNNDLSTTKLDGRKLSNSRLWFGVPQLSDDQIRMFEAAYTGHQFIFITMVPKFMSTGIYGNGSMPYEQIMTLKHFMEKMSTSISGMPQISAEEQTMKNGSSKLSFITNVTEEVSTINVTVHDVAGLPIKNSIELWLKGTIDPKSKHGNYLGNLGIDGGWCLANHTMSMLVVNTDPSWTVVQDAAFAYNMWPTEKDNDILNWSKGEYGIVDNVQVAFNCNLERSPRVNDIAVQYMNTRILQFAKTSVFNSREFQVSEFSDLNNDPTQGLGL